MLTRGQGATANFSLTSFQKAQSHLGSIRHWKTLQLGIGKAAALLFSFNDVCFHSLFNNVTEKKLCEKNKVLRVYLFIHSFISVE